MDSGSANQRIVFIDLARFYAMALVFYGHFIEELMLLKNPVAANQYKFIYSFHMVLFIVLAGYVAKERDVSRPVGDFLKYRLLSRLLPFIFFTLLMMIPPLFFGGKFYGLNLPSSEGYLKGIVSTLFGLPLFCVPSWFLLLIFSVEWVHFCTFRFLRKSNALILIGAVIFYLIGYLLNLQFDVFNPLKGRVVGWNYLFIHEAIVMYAFYLVGVYLRRRRFLMGKIPATPLASGAVISLLAVLFTYPLNKGQFSFKIYDAVIIMLSSHGQVLLFPFTALAGCALILFLARLSPSIQTMTWLGRNTLILMCLNGIFYHYVNPPAAKWLLEGFSGSAATVTAAGVLVTLASLSACIPLVFVLNRYVPQLVGKPKKAGPLLKNLAAI